jgi:tripartite-type tricarboxylate transporter receptor subunit TctC
MADGGIDPNEQLGLDTVGSAPAELAVVVKTDIAKWSKVIKEAGITAAD